MGNISGLCCQNQAVQGLDIYPAQELKFQPVPNFEERLNPQVQRVLQLLKQKELNYHPEQHKNLIKREPMVETKSKFIYDGQWNQRGLSEGRGKVYLDNGSYFEGQFKDGLANGQGRYIFPNGAYFQGQVEDNKARGQGKFKSEQVTFDGFWQASKPSIGKYTLSDGTIVELKTPHHGVINFKNGDTYEGAISTDLHPAGYGKMRFENGNEYEGDWRAGLMHGQGTFKWKKEGARQAVYQGQYENGKKNGIGKFTYGNGREYEGEWVNGQQHGEGTLRQNGEVIFKGYWTSGTPLRTSKAVQDTRGFRSSNLPVSQHNQSNVRSPEQSNVRSPVAQFIPPYSPMSDLNTTNPQLLSKPEITASDGTTNMYANGLNQLPMNSNGNILKITQEPNPRVNL